MRQMPRSSLIALATYSSVAVSATISITWFIVASGASRFEPAVQTLGLLAGLTGVLAERRAVTRERRHLALVTLAEELQRIVSILGDPQFAQSKEASRLRIYPRLPVSATDAALISGILAKCSDDDLLRRLHDWRDKVNGFNRRLELTEIRLCTYGVPAEIEEFDQALHHSNGYLNQIRRDLHNLQSYLLANYQITAKCDDKRDGNTSRDVTNEINPAFEWPFFDMLNGRRFSRAVLKRQLRWIRNYTTGRSHATDESAVPGPHP